MKKFYEEVINEHKMFKMLGMPIGLFPGYFMQCVFVAVLLQVARFVYHRKCHTYRYTSHVGPESGIEDFVCLRCGDSQRIIYY